MDYSGNSASLQSSSGGAGGGAAGGDEEFDSQTNSSISAFIHAPAAHFIPNISNLKHPQVNYSSSSTTMFDPLLSSYFDCMSRPPQNLQNPLNIDMVWPKTTRSDSNLGEIEINPLVASSSSLQPFGVPNIAISSPGVPLSDKAPVVRNPKKRTRASRRAPTTVLTTDTTNFRAMVQEFTGIPAPPFSSSSLLARTRVDLFGTPSTIRLNPLGHSLQPPHLCRTFTQNFQPPPPFFSSSSSLMVDALATMTSRNSTMDSELCLPKQTMQSSNLFIMENPVLTSLFQPNPPKLANQSSFCSKTQGSMQISSNDHSYQLGVSHGHENAPARWESRGGSDEGGQSDRVRFVNGEYDFSRDAENGKKFHSEKGTGMDNIGARNEGMMETWIGSSD